MVPALIVGAVVAVACVGSWLADAASAPTAEQVAKDYEGALGEIDACLAKIREAQGAGDQAKIAEWEACLPPLKAKAATYESQMQVLKEQAQRRKNLAELKAAGKAVVSGADVLPEAGDTPNTVPATPIDRAKQEIEEDAALVDWLGDRIPDTHPRIQALRAKVDGTRFVKGEGGVALPGRLARMVVDIPPAFDLRKEEDLKAFAAYSRWNNAKTIQTSIMTSPANLIPQDYRNELLMLPGEAANLFPRCRKVAAPTGTVVWPMLTQTDAAEWGGVVVHWTAEAGTKPQTEPTFEQLSISTHELSARTELSNTLLSRSVIDLEQFLSEMFRGAIYHAIDSALYNGSGTGRPNGIINETNIRRVNRQVANQVGYVDLVNLEHAVLSHHRAGAIWYMADDAAQYLKQIRDTDGRPIFVPNPSTGMYDRLLGYPIVTTHRTTLGNTGDIIFGNWSRYICPVEQNIVMKKSEHRKIEQNVTVFIVFMLVGGRCAQPRAFSQLVGVTGS